MKVFTVLVVDDDLQILDFLRPKLKGAGYDVLTATNGLEALQLIKDRQPDMLVLDMRMPGKDGLSTLKELRNDSAMPVIILSAKGSDADKIAGLEAGADDYLSKPFNPDELVSRIKALKRRLDPPNARLSLGLFSFENISIDFEKRELTVNGTEQHLTNKEWLLLVELIRNTERLVTYDYLLERVWGYEYRGDVQLVRSWMSRLRRKIEKDPGNPKLIRNIPKSGYIMKQLSSL